MQTKQTIQKKYFQLLIPGNYIDIQTKDSQWKIGKIIDKDKKLLYVSYDGWLKRQQQFYIGTYRVAPLRSNTIGYTGSLMKICRNNMPKVADLINYLEIVQMKFLNENKAQPIEITQLLRGQLFVFIHDLLCKQYSLDQNQTKQANTFLFSFLTVLIKILQKCKQYKEQYFNSSSTNKLLYLTNHKIALIQSLQELLILTEYIFKTQSFKFISLFKYNKGIISQEKIIQYFIQQKGADKLYQLFILNDKNGKWYPSSIRKSIYKILLTLSNSKSKYTFPSLPKYSLKDFQQFFSIMPLMIEYNPDLLLQNNFLDYSIKIILVSNSPFDAKLKSIQQIRKCLEGKTQFKFLDKMKIVTKIDQNGVLEELLDKNNFNPEVFKRFIPTLSILCKVKTLNLKHITSLFQILKLRHQSETQMIFQIISEISQFAPSSLLDNVFTQICKIDINSDQTLKFIKTFTINAIQNLSKQKSNLITSFFGRKKASSSKHGYYGLNLLYKQIQDQGKIIKQKIILSLNIIKEILQQNIFHQQKWNYLNYSIQFIKKKKNFGQSIKLISLIIQTYAQQSFFSQNRKKIIQKLQTKYGLIDHLIQGIKSIQKISQIKFNHQQILILFYQLIQIFSQYIKNPLKVKQIEYLWYKSDSNNYLLNFLKKQKNQKINNKKNLKLISSETIEQIFKHIITKQSFYKRKLTFKQFETIYQIFLSYHIQKENVSLNIKDGLVRYNKANLLLGFQYFINYLQAVSFQQNFEKACKKTIQLILRPNINQMKKSINQQTLIQIKVSLWVQIFKNCVHKLILSPKKCLYFIQSFYSEIQGRLYKEINIHDHSSISILVENQIGQIKTITIQRFSTIFRLRKLIKDKFKINNDFFMFNVKLNKNVSFQQEQDFSVNAMPLMDNGKSVSLKIQQKQNKMHHQQASVYLFKKIIEKQEKLYAQIFSIIQNANLNEQIDNLFWKTIDLLPLNKSMIQEVQKCQGFNSKKWQKYFTTNSDSSLQYKLNIIFALMKQSQKWTIKMYQKGGLNAIIGLFVNKISSWEFKLKNQSLCIKILEVILKIYQKCDKKNLQKNLIKQLNSSLIIILQNQFQTQNQLFSQNQISLNFINKALQIYLITLKALTSNKKQLQTNQLKECRFSLKIFINLLKQGLFQQKSQASQIFSEQYSISMIFSVFNSQQNKQIILQSLIGWMDIDKLLYKKRCQNYFKFLTTILYSFDDQISNKTTQQNQYENKIPSNIYQKIWGFINQIITFQNLKQEKTKQFDQIIYGSLNLLKFFLSQSHQNNKIKFELEQIYTKLIQYFLFPNSSIYQKRLKNQKNRKIFFDILKKITFMNPELIIILTNKITQFLKNNKYRKNNILNWNLHFQNNQKKHFVGLKNLGATCYANCLFQQLFMIKNFRQEFIKIDSRSFKQNLDKNQIYQLQNIFYSLKYGYNKYQTTKKFCQSFITYEGQPINTMIQSDADQFFNTLMEKIERFLKQTDKHQILEKTFEGKLSNQLICQGCPHKSQKIQSFMSIGVNLKNKKTLEQALKGYVQGQILDGQNAYYCQPCQKKVKTLKRLCIKQLPNILVIVLKRFQYDFDTYKKVKINSYLEFPQKIDMLKYTSDYLQVNQQQNMQKSNLSFQHNQNNLQNSSIFHLRGSVIHAGFADAGHYYSFIKQNEKWYEFNDQFVNQIDYNKVKEQGFGGQQKQDDFKMQKYKNAYILFYERQDFNKKSESKESINSIKNEYNLNQSNQIENNKQQFPQIMKKNVISQNQQSNIFSSLMQLNFINFWQNVSILKTTQIKNFIFLYFHTVILRDKHRYDYVTGYYRIVMNYLMENKQKELDKQDKQDKQQNNLQENISMAQWYLNQINSNYIKQFLIEAPKTIRMICVSLVLTAIYFTKNINEKIIEILISSLRKNGMTPFGLIFKALARKQQYRNKLKHLKYNQIIYNLLTNQTNSQQISQELQQISKKVKQNQIESFFGHQCKNTQIIEKQKCSAALLQSLQNFDLKQQQITRLNQTFSYRVTNKILMKKLAQINYSKALNIKNQSQDTQITSEIGINITKFEQKIVQSGYSKDYMEKYFFFIRYLILKCQSHQAKENQNQNQKQTENIQQSLQKQNCHKDNIDIINFLNKEIHKLSISSFQRFILGCNRLNEPMDYIIRQLYKISFHNKKIQHQFRILLLKNKNLKEKIQNWLKQIQKPFSVNLKDDFFDHLRKMDFAQKTKYLQNYSQEMKNKTKWMFEQMNSQNQKDSQINNQMQLSDLQNIKQNQIITIRNKKYKIKQKFGKGILYNVTLPEKQDYNLWAYLQKNVLQTFNNL